MKVAIVGAGAAGALATLAVRDRIPDAELTVFDPSNDVPRGIAYSFPQAWLRLNIPASKMGGSVEGDATSFADWLQRRHGLPSTEYATRYVYGDYLSQSLKALAIRGGFQIERSEVTSVRLKRDGRFQVFARGKSIEADGVILCTGHLPPNNFLEEHPRIVPDVWAPKALDGIDPDDRVLLIGTGSTAVDVVLTLKHASHRGSIIMVSPHGHLPIIDAPVVPYPDFFDRKRKDSSPRSLLRRLRAEVEYAESVGNSWQNVVNSFRQHTAEIWQGWSQRERKQFLRHGAQLWLIHRHRLPPDVAESLKEMVASKALEIRRARYKSLTTTLRGIEIQLVERSAPTKILVDRVLNCTGPSLAFEAASSPLYRQLFGDGMARQDELGLGLAVDDHSQLLNKQGASQCGLYVLGSATRGHFWEVIAVPDIRLRASMIAKHIQKWNGRRLQAFPDSAFRPGS